MITVFATRLHKMSRTLSATDDKGPSGLTFRNDAAIPIWSKARRKLLWDDMSSC